MRYGTMRDNVVSIEAILADGTLGHFGPIGGNLNDVPAPIAPARQRPAGDRRARGRRDRGALSEGAAPGRRLQSRCAGARQERRQSRPCAGGRRGHAGVLHPHRIEAVAAARPPRGRRRAFRQLLRGDERGAGDRAAEADRRRVDRPHHDRARPRNCDVPADAGKIRARDAGSDPAGRVRRGRSRGEPAPPAPVEGTDRRSRLQLGQQRRQMGRRRRGAQSRSAGGDHRRAHLAASTS